MITSDTLKSSPISLCGLVCYSKVQSWILDSENCKSNQGFVGLRCYKYVMCSFLPSLYLLSRQHA